MMTEYIPYALIAVLILILYIRERNHDKAMKDFHDWHRKCYQNWEEERKSLSLTLFANSEKEKLKLLEYEERRLSLREKQILVEGGKWDYLNKDGTVNIEPLIKEKRMEAVKKMRELKEKDRNIIGIS
uniref:Uncharacterized protein n=1 Tax=viral metagenome TaxID=1070528 RepID=A0A6H1ZII9_9ZZZZ